MSGELVRFAGPLLGWRNSHGTMMGYLSVSGAAAEAVAGHELLRRLEIGQRRGFGSVKVNARIGDSQWSTSVFPQDGGESWFLPVKAAIRRAEGLAEGEAVEVELELL